MNLLMNTLILHVALTAAQAAPAPTWRPQVVETIGTPREVTCLAVVEGELWSGTLGGGLVRMDGADSAALGTTHGLPGNRVNDCLTRDGDLWVATDQGLAVWERESGWFQTVEWGRFISLASGPELLLAGRDDGTMLRFGLKDNPHEPVRTRCELVPLSLAVGPHGVWAAGGVDGRVYLSKTRRYHRLKIPVTALAFGREGLVALTPTGAFLLGDEGFQPDLTRALATFMDGRGEVVDDMPAGAVRVTDRVVWQGRRWLATDAGLFAAPLAHSRRTSHSPTDGDDSQGAPPTDQSWLRQHLGGCPCGPRLSALAEFRGDLWVGGFDSGICRLTQGRWHHFSGARFLPSDMVNHMAATRSRLYVATLKGLAVVDRKGQFRQYTREMCVDNPRANCPWHSSVTGVAVDPETGRVWASDTGAVHRLSSRRWRHYYKHSGVLSDKVTRIAVHHGRIAVGTGDMGVHLRLAGRKFVTLDDQDGPADNWVMDLTFDRSGALWVATCTRGVSRFYQDRWNHWTAAQGLADDYTLSVADIDGRIWIGHFRGISILSERGVINLGTRQGLSGGEVHDILKYNKLVYLATDAGLTVLSTGV